MLSENTAPKIWRAGMSANFWAATAAAPDTSRIGSILGPDILTDAVGVDWKAVCMWAAEHRLGVG